MDGAPPTASKRVQIVNTYGLHMRPSTRFVKLAGTFASDIRVNFRDISANGKSILEMTSLAAERGTELDLEAHGPDAEAAITALSELVAAGFHMDEEGA
jgi:phosphocarrier protein